jgi:Flp pilus assembly protein TadD/energy-coupling factor transporter ATP-binding protein EcfA2
MNTQALVNTHHHYNPDWLSDEALVSGFVARMDDFTFLRDELAQTSIAGSAQHYLIVGVRGAGKTTLLKRLAVAIRQEDTLSNHLIALSFPEELYQVKDLADFWWACCEALADELDRLKKSSQTDALLALVDKTKKSLIGEKSELKRTNAGLDLLQSTCALLNLRPVLLIDNLDLVFNRIDKAGRKLKNPHAPAYWSLREALSNTNSPIVIGGSVRLSEQFTDYDKAFYDFFIPKRLGKLSIFEVREVIKRLAEAQNTPEVTERLNAHPGRLETLYELTGGNPRAIGLIFQLLQQSPGSKAVDDFERLMDITTPYYKARFEDLAEQAQVVMHALAVRRPTAPNGSGLRFGHTAAEIGEHAGLLTSTVSAQLDNMDKEGLIEKSSTSGRTQYRIAEQLFRLWLQMRGSRRIRQNVLGLTEFLEAMFSIDELSAGLQKDDSSNPLSNARYTFAMADSSSAKHMRRGLEAKGADQLMRHIASEGGHFTHYIAEDDLPEDLSELTKLRDKLQSCKSLNVDVELQNFLLGSVCLPFSQKTTFVSLLCDSSSASETLLKLTSLAQFEQRKLVRFGLKLTDLPLLYRTRAIGLIPLPSFSVDDANSTIAVCSEKEMLRELMWRLLGLGNLITFENEESSARWIKWGLQFAQHATPGEWANVASTMAMNLRVPEALHALDVSLKKGETSRYWCERASLLKQDNGDGSQVKSFYEKAIALDSNDALPWFYLGNLLADEKRNVDAETAYRKAIELDEHNPIPHNNLGFLLSDLQRNSEAEKEYRVSIALDAGDAIPHSNLGALLADLGRYKEAEEAYRNAIDLSPLEAIPHNNLGVLLLRTNQTEKAQHQFRIAAEIDPTYTTAWINLGLMLIDVNHWLEAKLAFEKAIDTNPTTAGIYAKQIDLVNLKIFVSDALTALKQKDKDCLNQVMLNLQHKLLNLPRGLASESFVEEFLKISLNDASQAKAVINSLREMNCEKHSRPLLLAFEAALANQRASLKDLEPELQAAAERMYQRLTA